VVHDNLWVDYGLWIFHVTFHIRYSNSPSPLTLTTVWTLEDISLLLLPVQYHLSLETYTKVTKHWWLYTSLFIFIKWCASLVSLSLMGIMGYDLDNTTLSSSPTRDEVWVLEESQGGLAQRGRDQAGSTSQWTHLFCSLTVLHCSVATYHNNFRRNPEPNILCAQASSSILNIYSSLSWETVIWQNTKTFILFRNCWTGVLFSSPDQSDPPLLPTLLI
jgi:hypothetical protein